MWMPHDHASLSLGKRVVLLLLTPFYSGREAVVLFFILSGLVLSLPYLRGRGQPYPIYLVRRILRIYGPYLVAIAFAVLGDSLWHGHPFHGEWAAADWSRAPSLHLVLQHVLFIGVFDWHQYDFVIWSLIQEMRISILFPLLWLLVRRFGGSTALAAGVVFSAAALYFLPGYPDTSTRYSLLIALHYITFFVVGILLASGLTKVEVWWKRLSQTKRRLLMLAACIAYFGDATFAVRGLRPFFHGEVPVVTWGIVADWIAAAGAAGLIVICLHEGGVRRALKTMPARFLGRISYSLYLVHPVVLLAITFGFGEKLSLWVQFPIYVAGSLVVAWLFCMAVEEQFIRWSRAVANWAAAARMRERALDSSKPTATEI